MLLLFFQVMKCGFREFKVINSMYNINDTPIQQLYVQVHELSPEESSLSLSTDLVHDVAKLMEECLHLEHNVHNSTDHNTMYISVLISVIKKSFDAQV